MARVYATPVQLATWLGLQDPPAGADRRLRAASRKVDEMLLTAVYPTDELTGLPTEAEHITALQDATCAQAEFNASRGDPFGTGVNPGGFSLGRLAISQPQRRQDRIRTQLPDDWSGEAWAILQQAALTGFEPHTSR